MNGGRSRDVAGPFAGELCGCTEEGPDGFEDLKLKFATPAVVETLLPAFFADERVLTLTGNLLDGTSFEASDCIVIRGAPKDAIALAPGSEAEGDSDSDTDTDAKGSFGLFTNSPPSHRVQHITYRLPEGSEVRLTVYDVSGRVVQQLVQTFQSSGNYTLEWDTSRLSSGIYFYRLNAGSLETTRKLILIH